VNKIAKIQKSCLLQHDSSDCGVACLVSVIRYYGGNASLERIRKLSGTSVTGTTLLGLYQAATQSGIDATGYEATITDISVYENALILHVSPEVNLEHYVVCFGKKDGKFILWDPAKGLTFLSDIELDLIWKSKKCLGLIPNSSFTLEKEDRSGKTRWLFNAIKPEKDLLIVSIVIGIIISGLGLVMAVFTQKLIDKILPSGDIKLLIAASALVLILLTSRIVFSAIRQFFLLVQGKTFNIRIVEDFYNSLLFLPKAFFDTRKTGDLVARLNDTMRIQRVIAEIVGTYIIDILIILVSVVMLFYYSDLSALISIICLPIIYFLVKRWNIKIISAQHDLMAGYALNESNFISSLKGISEIKSLNWQEDFSAKNRIIYSDFQERAVFLGKIKVRLNLITGIAGTLYLVIVLLYASLQVIDANMTQGELMAILSLSSLILPSVLNLALIGIPLSEAKVALDRMFEFKKIESEQVGIVPDDTPDEFLKLSLVDISFRFPGQKLLLDKISITVKRGELISLVGESGCGKSTLANIILRFYSSESGSVLVNDVFHSEKYGLKKWRSKVGIIPQEIHIFNGTILQNLITDLTEDKIKEMVSIISNFGLSGFIDSFPAGIMTLVGEEGINLSGGQKQLLAFIRVLLKKPDILVIDEGTSNMDRNTETTIVNILTKLKSQMGIIFISHRINLIKKLSDRIYVIENRVLVAEGTHKELIRTDNLYKHFWDDFY